LLGHASCVSFTSNIWSGLAKKDYPSVVFYFVINDWELEKHIVGMITKYISYKMTKWSEKDYRAHNNAMIILSADERVPTGDDRGRGPPSFLLPARTGRRGSILLDHLWQRRASLSLIIVAT
jgi:hypothetical protein